MPLTREELDHIAASTLANYDERAEDYWQGTRDHDHRCLQDGSDDIQLAAAVMAALESIEKT